MFSAFPQRVIRQRQAPLRERWFVRVGDLLPSTPCASPSSFAAMTRRANRIRRAALVALLLLATGPRSESFADSESNAKIGVGFTTLSLGSAFAAAGVVPGHRWSWKLRPVAGSLLSFRTIERGYDAGARPLAYAWTTIRLALDVVGALVITRSWLDGEEQPEQSASDASGSKLSFAKSSDRWMFLLGDHC